MTDSLQSHCWLLQLFNIICLHSKIYDLGIIIICSYYLFIITSLVMSQCITDGNAAFHAKFLLVRK